MHAMRLLQLLNACPYSYPVTRDGRTLLTMFYDVTFAWVRNDEDNDDDDSDDNDDNDDNDGDDDDSDSVIDDDDDDN